MLWAFSYGNLMSFMASKDKKLLEKNLELHNKYKNKRIFIFFTGRSIQDIDFSKFKDEYVMGVNFLALDSRFKELNAEFYCYATNWDASWAKLAAFGLHEIYQAINMNVKLILNASSKYWINNLDIFGNLEDGEKFKNNIYFINNTAFIPDGRSEVACGIKKNGKTTGGILPRSINIAIDLGFKDIYLIGADYSKNPLRVGHFYGSTDFIAKRSLEEEEINLGIRNFAKKQDVNIINVIEKDQTSFGFDSIFLEEVYSNCLLNETSKGCE